MTCLFCDRLEAVSSWKLNKVLLGMLKKCLLRQRTHVLLSKKFSIMRLLGKEKQDHGQYDEETLASIQGNTQKSI